MTSDLKTSLTIEELWLHTDSRLDPGPPLLYLGARLSESELLKARRVRAARMAESSPSVVSSTLEAAKRWLVRKTASTREFYHEQIYQSYVQIDRVVDAASVLDVEGASIMGYGWSPKSSLDFVRVKVVIPAWTDQPNSVVAALFVNDSVVANKAAVQELIPGKVGEVVLEFEMVTPSTQPVALNIRVGSGRPGIIHLNGDANGPVSQMAKPTLTIEEYRPFWRLVGGPS